MSATSRKNFTTVKHILAARKPQEIQLTELGEIVPKIVSNINAYTTPGEIFIHKGLIVINIRPKKPRTSHDL